jgi:hypothetical protein
MTVREQDHNGCTNHKKERKKPKAFHNFSARMEGGRRVKKGSCCPGRKKPGLFF